MKTFAALTLLISACLATPTTLLAKRDSEIMYLSNCLNPSEGATFSEMAVSRPNRFREVV